MTPLHGCYGPKWSNVRCRQRKMAAFPVPAVSQVLGYLQLQPLFNYPLATVQARVWRWFIDLIISHSAVTVADKPSLIFLALQFSPVSPDNQAIILTSCKHFECYVHHSSTFCLLEVTISFLSVAALQCYDSAGLSTWRTTLSTINDQNNKFY